MTDVRALIAALAAATSFGAQASLTLASSPACSVTDTTLTATACSGAWEGNNMNQQSDVLAELASLSGLPQASLSFQGSSDDANAGPFTAGITASAGTLTFDAPIDGAFAVTLKAGNQFSLYYFDGAGPAVSQLSFSTLGTNVNGRGIAQDLSHASLYTSNLGVVAIPEPGGAAMMLAGLMAVGMVARRRRS